ncbi:hypothetical protein [Microlunatus speluncae]|uniref:hypothetical protein n=1 Tax=Microlunatus speluncae TaxID=2594267 RepID=UPI0015815B7C|nr:hypothetical protein [Microlunatus speluncae]
MAERKKLMVEVAGRIDAPLDRVWPELKAGIAATETDGTTLAYQGGWWYRGEWSAESDGAGTLIIHRVFNVAAWMRWGVPLANRFFIGFRDTTRSGFEQAITEIARRLGTTATPQPTCQN